MTRHINIPIFVPHLGCPHQCSFCNQRYISGAESFSLDEMEKTVRDSLSTAGDSEVEIAFFGGSFTGIDRALMTEILSRVQPYLKSGAVRSLRCSTRPDYIDKEVLSLLSFYGMRTVELGIQSTDGRVLEACRRGHTAQDARRAAALIREHGMDLVGQMMIGLPEATPESEKETARAIVSLGAVGARVYPTVVFKQTPLCRDAETGKYRPLSLSEAVKRSADAVEILREGGVSLLRVGLHASDALLNEDLAVAGPRHPALGELVESELYKRKIISLLEAKQIHSPVLCLSVAKGCTSKAVGQHRSNTEYLSAAYGFSRVRVIEREGLAEGEVIIEEREERREVCT